MGKLLPRSEAEVSYQKAVFEFRNMFRNMFRNLPVSTEINKLEKLVSDAELEIKAVEIRNKPRRKARRKDDRKEAREAKKAANMLAKQKEQARIAAKRKAEQRRASAQMEARRIEHAKSQEKKFKSRIIDTSELVPLRLDAKTVVYIKPGADPEAVREKFRLRNEPRVIKQEKRQTGGEGIHWYE